MCVTPLACRYFLAHATRAIRTASGGVHRPRSPIGYRERASRAALPFRLHGHRRRASCWWRASIWMATSCPARSFPEIDESMERVYVRLAPGHLARRRHARSTTWARLAKELPPRTVDLSSRTSGSPGNARSAMTSPNAGPHMGFIRVALPTPSTASQPARGRRPDARDLTRAYPGRGVPPVARRARRQRVLERVPGAAGRRAGRRQPGGARLAVQGRRRGRTDRPRHPRRLSVRPDRLPRDTGRNRPHAGGAGRRERAGAAQTTLEATLGNINTPSVWIDGSTANP